MPGPALKTDAIVLLKRPATDAFEALTVFSPEEGGLRILHRVPRKPNPAHVPLDLFDEVALWLEAAAGGSWFVKEARLITRPAGIGQRYDRLQGACAFANVIAHNPIPEESRAIVYRLLQTSLAAFAATARPEVVSFKSLYCFARDEGHPLKQHWFPTLPAADRALVGELLNRPVSDQTTPAPEVTRLLRRLEEYLQGHTELVLA